MFDVPNIIHFCNTQNQLKHFTSSSFPHKNLLISVLFFIPKYIYLFLVLQHQLYSNIFKQLLANGKNQCTNLQLSKFIALLKYLAHTYEHTNISNVINIYINKTDKPQKIYIYI